MRWFLPLLLLVLTGCPEPRSHPYDACDDLAPCEGEFSCIGFRCVPHCQFEGDCDLGFRCIDNQCIAECEQQSDCELGTCSELGGGHRGEACLLTDLPQCDTDGHCAWGVCLDGVCEPRCDWPEQCGTGRVCDFVRDDYGYCRLDPDYEPPPEPANCGDALSPNRWCAARQPGTTCDVSTQTCVETWAAIVLADATPDCDDANREPGGDIMSVILRDDSGQTISTIVSYQSLGRGSNDHTDLTGLWTTQTAQCERDPPEFVSLGCDGHLILVGAVSPMRPGWEVEVVEDRWCRFGEEADRVAISVCRSFPGDFEDPLDDCDALIGTTYEGTSWTLPP